MTKYCFDYKIKLSDKTKSYLDQVNVIIAEYQQMGHLMTLRQLYYQLVGRVVIENNNEAYRKLSRLLTDGRMAGYVDWDVIEDRLRVPRIPYYENGFVEAIEKTAYLYKINRMTGQPRYVEVWVEKDALSEVMYKITSEYRIPLMVNRGFSSCTAMHDAYLRFSQHNQGVILYAGDHDPSGMCMHEDIRNRFNTFGLNVEVKRIALNFEQVQKYELPENRLKKDTNGNPKDPRGKAYQKQYGDMSWELDALNPLVLDQILRDEIEAVIDKNQYLAMLEKEAEEKEILSSIAAEVRGAIG